MFLYNYESFSDSWRQSGVAAVSKTAPSEPIFDQRRLSAGSCSADRVCEDGIMKDLSLKIEVLLTSVGRYQ